MKTKAQTILEYTILLGTVGAVLLTMNIYVKRGFQGRVKSMADNWINDGKAAQVDQIDPKVKTTSNTTTTTASSAPDRPNSFERTFTGGGRIIILAENTHTESDSLTKEEGKTNKPNTGSFVSAEDGLAGDVSRPTDDEFAVSEWKKSMDIKYLSNEKQRLLEYADTLEDRADEVERRGNETLGRISGIIRFDTPLYLFEWIDDAFRTRVGTPIQPPRYRFMPTPLLRASRDEIEAREVRSYGGSTNDCREDACAQAAVSIFRAGKEMLQKAADMRKQASDVRQEAVEIQKKIDLLRG